MKLIRKLLWFIFLIILALALVCLGYYFAVTKDAVLSPEKLVLSDKRFTLYDCDGARIENASLATAVAGIEATERVTALLKRVGLGDRLNHLPNELSGGEQQRVAIARALAHNPSIIFADEPTGNLDSRNGRQILDLLFELADEGNKTLVMVTHDPDIARLGDRVLTIRDGVVQ